MKETKSNWANAATLVVIFVAVLWIIESINSFFGHTFDSFGIYPRKLDGLYGVVLWVFIHGNFQHLIMNTTPLLILGYFVALRGSLVFFEASIIILVLGGIGVWLFGRPAFHIGASGLVFGYFGFLIAVGIYEKSLSALLIAAFILFYYGGMVFGVLPVDSFISWEGHLFGLLAGIFAARLLATRSRPHEIE